MHTKNSSARWNQRLQQRLAPLVHQPVIGPEACPELPVGPAKAAFFQLRAHEARPGHAAGGVGLGVGAELAHVDRAVVLLAPLLGLVEGLAHTGLVVGTGEPPAHRGGGVDPLRTLVGELEGVVEVDGHDQVGVGGEGQPVEVGDVVPPDRPHDHRPGGVGLAHGR